MQLLVVVALETGLAGLVELAVSFAGEESEENS